MKLTRHLTAALLALAVLAGPYAGLAADQPKETKTKAYLLKTCVVSGEKLGEMGNPYVFVYQGQEIKLCCKNCLKDFKKDPAKYLKKIEEEQARAAK